MADPPPRDPLPPKDAPPDVSAEHLEKMEDIIKTRVEKGQAFSTIKKALWQYRADNKLPATTVSYGWIRKMMWKFSHKTTVDLQAKIKEMEEREYALWKLAAVALDPDEGVDDMNPVGGLISVHGKHYVKKYFAEEYAEYCENMGIETDEDDEDDEDVTDGSGGDEGLAKKMKDMTVDGGTVGQNPQAQIIIPSGEHLSQWSHWANIPGCHLLAFFKLEDETEGQAETEEFMEMLAEEWGQLERVEFHKEVITFLKEGDGAKTYRKLMGESISSTDTSGSGSGGKE